MIKTLINAEAAGRKPSGEPRTIAPTPDGLRRAAFMGSRLKKWAAGREISGHRTPDRFVDVNKTIEISSETQRVIEDIMLTRYAGKPALVPKHVKAEGRKPSGVSVWQIHHSFWQFLLQHLKNYQNGVSTRQIHRRACALPLSFWLLSVWYRLKPRRIGGMA